MQASQTILAEVVSAIIYTQPADSLGVFGLGIRPAPQSDPQSVGIPTLFQLLAGCFECSLDACLDRAAMLDFLLILPPVIVF